MFNANPTYNTGWKRVKIFDNRNFCLWSDHNTDGKPTVIDYRIDKSTESVELLHLTGPMPMLDAVLSIIVSDNDFRKEALHYIEENSNNELLYNCDVRYGQSGHEYYTFQKWSVCGHLEKVTGSLEATFSGKYDFQRNGDSLSIWMLIALILWYVNIAPENSVNQILDGVDVDENEYAVPVRYVLRSGKRTKMMNFESVLKTYNKKIIKSRLRKIGIRIKYLPGYHNLESEFINKSDNMFTF